MRKKLALLLIPFLLTGCTISHIEDTNGIDNYELQTLSEENFNSSFSSYIALGFSTFSTSSKATYKAKKFSGVRKVDNLKGVQSVHINTVVTSGNFLMAFVSDDEYIYIKANENKTLYLSSDEKYDVKIAGESAAFEVTLEIVR